MQIEHIYKDTGYIDTGYGLITVYRSSENEVILLDSGDDRADELISLLDKSGLTVRAIVCTHLHSDHIANNNALYAKYNCDIFVYTTDINDFIERRNPKYPYHIIDPTSDLVIDNVKIGIFPTPGHIPDHLSLVTPDGVCCLGDSIISQPLLDNSKLPYIEDVERAILTMEDIRTRDHPYFVVSHRGVISQKDISSLIDANIKKELDIYDILRRQIATTTTMEEAVLEFMVSRKISAKRIQQSEHMRNTVKARIRTLADAGEFIIEGEKIIPLNFSNS